MSISESLYSLSDIFARRMPGPLRLIASTANYHIKADNPFLYESARMIRTAFALVMNNRVPGDYAEFGVFEGRTTIEAWRAARASGFDEMRFRIFDSFEGLPEVKGIDEGTVFETGQYACTRERFEANMKKFGADLSRFDIVPGFYDETLPRQKDDSKIAVAWIDCDLYASTVPVLEYLTPRLADGSVICFDDWFCYNGRPDAGEHLACREWLDKNPQIALRDYQTFHWAGKSFIVNLEK